MRLDKGLKRSKFTKRELFFMECWFSLCHLHSLDNDRVSHNNVLNATNELLQLYLFNDKHGSVDKRALVTLEMVELMESDRQLENALLLGVPQHILALCDKKMLRDPTKSAVECQRELVVSLVTQFRSLLMEHYRFLAAEDLEYLLKAELGDKETEEKRFEKIYSVTEALISHVLTLGMTVAECFMLYKNCLSSVSTSFEEAFSLLKKSVTRAQSIYQVSIFLRSQKLYELIGKGRSRKYQDSVFYTLDEEDITADETLPTDIKKRKKSLVQVDIEVSAISIFSARTQAEFSLNQSLDRITYMVKREPIERLNSFGATFLDGNDNEIKKFFYNFEKPLQTSLDRLGDDEFELYMETMDRVQRQASKETISKINAAFRYFQNGVSESSQESQLSSLWSALESITQGVSSKGMGKDEHVHFTVLPCIALDYLIKQLFALKGVSKTLNWKNIEVEGKSIEIQTLNLGDLYTLLKNQHVKQEIVQRLDDYPYAQYKFSRFIELCQCPYKLALKMGEHKNKVSMQLSRLYRFRNAIVHNSQTGMRLDIILANLEHYLRSTLNAMIYTMHHATTISSPEEAFIRYRHMFEAITNEMNPLQGLTNKSAIEGMKKQIENGNAPIRDSLLTKWLEVHQ